MSAFSLQFQPYLPAWVLAALGIAALVLVAWGIVRRAKGAWLRLALALLLLGALADPCCIASCATRFPDTVVLLADRSASQSLGERTAQTDAALATLRDRLKSIPGLDVREANVDDSGNRGTALFGGLRDALAQIDRERLAGSCGHHRRRSARRVPTRRRVGSTRLSTCCSPASPARATACCRSRRHRPSAWWASSSS